jgi:phosphoesterase RecJ-like protein
MTLSPLNPELVPTASPSEETSADSVAAILAVLRRGERFLVCSHSRPDGDAVGSMIAFGMLLEQMGKRADLITPDHVPAVYRSLPAAQSISSALSVCGSYDAAILLECDGLERTRVRGLEQFFLINIDHHVTGRPYANLNWIDRSAASVGELVYRIVRAAGAVITSEMATCLYTTILTDTGSFTYGSLSAGTFALARDLVLAGADPIAIARRVYFSTPESKVVLLGAAIRNLHRDQELAWLWITNNDMLESGAQEEDCEGIANVGLGIAGVEAAVFLRELPEGQIHLSLRGKGRVNVAAIAEKLGGGGHENAAGCSLDGPLPHAVDLILNELRTAVAALKPASGTIA